MLLLLHCIVIEDSLVDFLLFIHFQASIMTTLDEFLSLSSLLFDLYLKLLDLVLHILIGFLLHMW